MRIRWTEQRHARRIERCVATMSRAGRDSHGGSAPFTRRTGASARPARSVPDHRAAAEPPRRSHTRTREGTAVHPLPFRWSSTSTSTSRAAPTPPPSASGTSSARPSKAVGSDAAQGVVEERTRRGGQYVIARLEPAVIRHVAETDREAGQESRSAQAIYRIWPDFKVRPHTTRSIATVKVDAARTTFAAWGEGIVWAVLDSGIDGKHPHFKKYKNLDLQSPLEHRDFTGGNSPLTDEFGHGTHVAGILAGYAKHSRSVPLERRPQIAGRVRPDHLRPGGDHRDLRHGAAVQGRQLQGPRRRTVTVRPARSSRRCRRSHASTTTAATSRSTGSTSAWATRSTPSGSRAGTARCATRSTSSSPPGSSSSCRPATRATGGTRTSPARAPPRPAST